MFLHCVLQSLPVSCTNIQKNEEHLFLATYISKSSYFSNHSLSGKRNSVATL